MTALKELAQAPGTNIALNGLVSTVKTLNPMVRYLGPYQTVCDDWNYWWTYLSEHISEQTAFGFAQRALLEPDQRRPSPTTSARRAPRRRSTAACRDSPAGRQRVPARPAVRRGDRHPGQRRLRDRPARLPEEAQLLRPAGTQPRRRPAHPRRSGPDVPRPHSRSGGRDLQPRTPTTGPQLPANPIEPMRRRRKRTQDGMSTFTAGLIAIVAIVVFTYLGFTKFANPFASPYTVHAVFSSANGLRPTRSCGSPASTSARSRASPPSRAARSRRARNATPPT